MTLDLSTLLERIRLAEPKFQQLTCCSFAYGSHFTMDSIRSGGPLVVGGSLVPPHFPVVDEDSGVITIPWSAVKAVQGSLSTVEIHYLDEYGRCDAWYAGYRAYADDQQRVYAREAERNG